MLLQRCINELNSGIINIFGNKIEITGFLSEERLIDYYDKGYDCRFSIGLYKNEPFNISYIKTNALFIILKNGKEISRHKFIPIKKDIINYKDIKDNKAKSKMFIIRQCYYTKKYNYIDNKNNLLFNSNINLKEYFKDEYNFDLVL